MSIDPSKIGWQMYENFYYLPNNNFFFKIFSPLRSIRPKGANLYLEYNLQSPLLLLVFLNLTF